MHEDLCLGHGWAWPVTIDEVRRCCNDTHNTLAHLPKRCREMVYISHRLYSMPDEVQVQTLDSNASIDRINRESGPWTPGLLPTLLGSSKPVIRTRTASGEVAVRMLHGQELLALAGWGVGDYLKPTSVAHSTCSSLAGNAFSAFSCGPVALAAVMGAAPILP